MVGIGISVFLILYGIYYTLNYKNILRRKFKHEEDGVPEASIKIGRTLGVIIIVVGVLLLGWNLIKYFYLDGGNLYVPY